MNPITFIKKLFRYPKYKIVKERDQYNNTRYSVMCHHGDITGWWYIDWDKEISFAYITKTLSTFDSYEKAEEILLHRQKQDKQQAEKVLLLIQKEKEEQKKASKFKSVLVVDYSE